MTLTPEQLPETITPRNARIVVYTLAIQLMRANAFDGLSDQVRSELHKANAALVAQLEENLRYYQRKS
jgi:hypothetical protein